LTARCREETKKPSLANGWTWTLLGFRYHTATRHLFDCDVSMAAKRLPKNTTRRQYYSNDLTDGKQLPNALIRLEAAKKTIFVFMSRHFCSFLNGRWWLNIDISIVVFFFVKLRLISLTNYYILYYMRILRVAIQTFDIPECPTIIDYNFSSTIVTIRYDILSPTRKHAATWRKYFILLHSPTRHLGPSHR